MECFSSGPPADYLIIFAFPICDPHGPQSTDSRSLRLGSADRLGRQADSPFPLSIDSAQPLRQVQSPVCFSPSGER